MTDYISREAALNNLAKSYFAEVLDDLIHAEDAVNAVSAADVVEVVHGKWIWDGESRREYPYKCSECGKIDFYAFLYDSETRKYKQQDNFCPNCGAKMDGGDGDG